MEEVEVRSTKLEIELNQEKIRLYKLCLQWGDNILEKSSLGEGFKWERRKRIDGVSLFVKKKAKRQWILTKWFFI